MTLAAIASGIAIALPLLDAAIKDHNYQKVKQYQNQIDSLIAQSNITQAQLNNLLNKYNTRYSEAISSLNLATRGSVQYDKTLEKLEDARKQIKTINSELTDKASKYEKANKLLAQEKSKYENKGLVQTVSELVGRGGNNV